MRLAVAVLLVSFAASAQELLTVEEAVHRAVLRNPTAVIAQREIERAQATLWQVRAPALPQLNANASYTHLDSARQLGATVVTPQNTFLANAQLIVPLVAASRWTAWLHAKDQIEVAQTSAEDVRRTVAIATARAYLLVFAQHRLVTINQQARDNAKNHLDDARARLEVGSGNRLDVVRAGQEMATDESNLASTLAQLARAMETLGVLVSDEGPIDVVDIVQLPTLPDDRTAMAESQSRRQDVRAARQRLESAQHLERDWWEDYLPLLSGVITPAYANPATTTNPQTSWSAALVLTLPIFDGGLRHGIHRENTVIAAESREQLDGLLRQARSEIRTGFEAVRRADESVHSGRDAARLAHEALDMTMLAYREGATNDLEVVDAERRARDADAAALIAEDTARQARIDLLSASGRFP
jgi:outer membrane protein TolC